MRCYASGAAVVAFVAALAAASFADAQQHQLRVTAEPPAADVCDADLFRRDLDEESPRPFIIVTTQRSGSTWIMSELARLPCTQTMEEMFSEGQLGDVTGMYWAWIAENKRGVHPANSSAVARVYSGAGPAPSIEKMQLDALRTYYTGEGMLESGCTQIPFPFKGPKGLRPGGADYERLPSRFAKTAVRARCTMAKRQARSARLFASNRGSRRPTCPGVPRGLGFKVESFHFHLAVRSCLFHTSISLDRRNDARSLRPSHPSLPASGCSIRTLRTQ